VAVLGLDQEVHLIALDGELKDTETAPRSPREPAAERAEDEIPAQRGQWPPSAEGHMRGVPTLVRRAHAVRDADPAAGWLPAGPGTMAAPGAGTELELSAAPGHLD